MVYQIEIYYDFNLLNLVVFDNLKFLFAEILNGYLFYQVLACITIGLNTVPIYYEQFDSLPIHLHRAFSQYPQSDWLPWIAWTLCATCVCWVAFDLWGAYEDSKDPEKDRARRKRKARYKKYRSYPIVFDVIDDKGNRVTVAYPAYENEEDSDMPGW